MFYNFFQGHGGGSFGADLDELVVVLVERLIGHEEMVRGGELVPVGGQDILIDAGVQDDPEEGLVLAVVHQAEICAVFQQLQQPGERDRVELFVDDLKWFKKYMPGPVSIVFQEPCIR